MRKTIHYRVKVSRKGVFNFVSYITLDDVEDQNAEQICYNLMKAIEATKPELSMSMEDLDKIEIINFNVSPREQ